MTKSIKEAIGNSNLQEAIVKGRTKQALELIKKMNKKNLNIRNKTGKTALHIAAEFANNEVIDALFAAGCDVSMKDKNEQTAIELYGQMIPGVHGDQMQSLDDTTFYLLTDKNSGNYKNPISFMLKNKDYDRLTKLVECGLDMNMLIENGKSLIQTIKDEFASFKQRSNTSLALISPESTENQAKLEKIIRLFEKEQNKFSMKKETKLKAEKERLQKIDDKKNIEIANLSHDNKYDFINISLNKENLEQYNLYKAIAKGKTDKALKLINSMNKENLNAVNNKGETAFVFAAKLSNVEIMAALVAKGCDVNKGSSENFKEIHKIFEKNISDHNRREIAESLLNDRNSSEYQPFSIAIRNFDKSTVEKLIKSGLDSNCPEQNSTPLQIANKELSALKEKISQTNNKKEKSVLKDELKDLTKIIKILEKEESKFMKKSGINMKDISKKDGTLSPLYSAVARGDVSSVVSLIEKESNIKNITNQNGKNIADFAINLATKSGDKKKMQEIVAIINQKMLEIDKPQASRPEVLKQEASKQKISFNDELGEKIHSIKNRLDNELEANKNSKVNAIEAKIAANKIKNINEPSNEPQPSGIKGIIDKFNRGGKGN